MQIAVYKYVLRAKQQRQAEAVVIGDRAVVKGARERGSEVVGVLCHIEQVLARQNKTLHTRPALLQRTMCIKEMYRYVERQKESTSDMAGLI